MFLITYAVVLFVLLTNFKWVKGYFDGFLSVLMPVVYGIFVAFVLNIPLRFFETRVFASLERKSRLWQKIHRPVCILIVFVLAIALIVALFSFIIPGLSQSVVTFSNNIYVYADTLQKFVADIGENIVIPEEIWEQMTAWWNDFLSMAVNALKNFLPHLFNFTKSLTSSVVSVFMGIIMGIYMLANKEKLARQSKKLLYAFLQEKTADKILEVGKISNRTFSEFVSGQLTEAFIIAVLCFTGMSILRMPYALLVSAFVGITALIPIFGAFIGAAFGAFIILLVDPMKAIWFLVFIIVLQQVEGNLIYPRVMGSSIGLPGLWVMFAMLCGSALMGFTGILLGIPTFSVFYTLFGRYVNRRLKNREVPPDKVEATPPQEEAEAAD
ncbi:AI-2E family transporter [Feifania hominis]|uniref:AI-2E family transporter n=1 Tax=Feifania hominis TaxID=2763660 RepID=A0A926HTG3_9FIRM|nr:AI-2E family transporter [Feifania hominis]MBC8535278.1 AI-2E family transporter [Feifania hominis]